MNKFMVLNAILKVLYHSVTTLFPPTQETRCHSAR
jgi:hypothetical protein